MRALCSRAVIPKLAIGDRFRTRPPRCPKAKETKLAMLDAIDGRTKWRRRRHLLPILAVACLGLVVAVATWLAASTWEARLAKVNFANLAGDYASVLQNGLDQYLAKMIVMRAFYDSSVEVDKDEFEVFTGRILKGTPLMARL